MFGQSVWSLAVAAGFGSAVLAQLSGWETDQVNTTLCTWQGLRVAVVRDTVYLDGGYTYWRPGLSGGSYGDVILDEENKPGIVYTLNFSTPFNTSQNISAIFGQQIKGTATPLYYDGAMLANDDEYFLYGGMLTKETNEVAVEPPNNQGLKFAGFSYGVEKPGFSAAFATYQLTGEITRYLAYGGAANVPSENLAFYFSGLHGPTWDEVYYPPLNASTTPNVVSNTLITLNMATQLEETWNNDTLSDGISGRASPELIWVPVGKQGILVALGGVVYPDFVSGGRISSNKTASEAQSPIFMSNIDIYDVSNKKWYTQSTSGGPDVALAQGCAVMQPAKDFSSFNIYWYGGYDGLHPSNETYWTDAVWVLSLPSFTWKQVAPGRSGMARAGHKCVMPYPDQMMVIGGAPVGQSAGYACVTDFIQIFNVSSTEWLDSYDPTVYNEYLVPSVIHEAIGGDGSGGATTTAPSRWDHSALEDVFQTAYATSKITTWYPYPKATTTSSTNPTYTDNSKSSGGGGEGGTPKYLGPVLGVIFGLVLLSSFIIGAILWRRRRLLNKTGGVRVIAHDDGQGGRIMSWLSGQQKSPDMANNKAVTITTTSELVHPVTPTPDLRFNQASQYPFTQVYQVPEQQSPPQWPVHYEVDNNEVIELPGDNSPRAAELSDTHMSPSDIVQRRFANVRSDITSQGSSSIQLTDQGSMVSSTSFPRNVPPAPPSSESHATTSVAGGGRRPPLSPQQQQRSPTRPESTALPTPLARAYGAKELPATPLPSSPQNTTPRGESGVSDFSERDRSHLRNISDPATVSTMGGTIAPRSQTTRGNAPILEEGAVAAANAAQPLGPVSPPTGGEATGQDYLDARTLGGVVSPVDGRLAEPPTGPVRRSAFRESDEDLGGRGQ